MKIIRQLEEQNGFTHNEQVIAGYILKQKYKILSLSATALARETYNPLFRRTGAGEAADQRNRRQYSFSQRRWHP